SKALTRSVSSSLTWCSPTILAASATTRLEASARAVRNSLVISGEDGATRKERSRASLAEDRGLAILLASAEFLTRLAVEILVQIGRIEFYLRQDAVRHVHFRRPEDGIDDQATEVFVGPVAMEVAAGEAERSAAVRAIECPGYDLL